MLQENNIYFKIWHCVLYLKQKIYDNAHNKNNLPQFCSNSKTKREGTLRVLYRCNNKCKIWKHFFDVIRKLSSVAKMTSTNYVLVFIALVEDKKLKQLPLANHIAILKEIRKVRNLLN